MAASKKKKMVALHGKGGTAASFEEYMRPLVEATSDTWEWEFIDGPFESAPGKCWWVLKPGERTFEAKELIGCDESLALLDKAWPFDGVMGFSQGAMLAAIACGRGLGPGSTKMGRPPVAIIVGAAFPTCRGADVNKLKMMEYAAAESEVVVPESVAASPGALNFDPLVKSLHVIGKRDAMNPPEQGMKVAEAFGPGAQLLEHGGGHTVPLDADAVRRYLEVMGVEVNPTAVRVSSLM